MIPKTIHYCWFGKKRLPDLAIKCIESWQKYLPDYKIVEWNEDNFNHNTNIFTKEAYLSQKFAFVADYVRLLALYSHGGIYMDTDVELIKTLDSFLHYPAFIGYEDEANLQTGIIGSEKGGVWVKEQLDYYENRHFILPNGSLDMTTNVEIVSQLMLKQGFTLKDSRQNFKNAIEIFPKDYFCPKSPKTGKIKITSNTYAIHHFAGSWTTTSQRINSFIGKILPQPITSFIQKISHKIKGRHK